MTQKEFSSFVGYTSATLSDIFEMLFLIQEYSDIQIYANEDTVFCRNHDNEICRMERSIIHETGFQPYTIDAFMGDWKKYMICIYQKKLMKKYIRYGKKNIKENFGIYREWE